MGETDPDEEYRGEVIQADAEATVAADGTVEVEYAVRVTCDCGKNLKLYSTQRRGKCPQCGEQWRVRS